MNFLYKLGKFFGILKKNRFEPLMTIEQILATLNTGTETKWIPVEGLFSLNEVSVQLSGGVLSSVLTKRSLINFNPSKGLVVKVFMHQGTGELKTYIAKSITDLPDRESL